jgi:hypothetical protein
MVFLEATHDRSAMTSGKRIKEAVVRNTLSSRLSERQGLPSLPHKLRERSELMLDACAFINFYAIGNILVILPLKSQSTSLNFLSHDKNNLITTVLNWFTKIYTSHGNLT